MSYLVKQIDESREQFGPYWYEIFNDDRLVARYWHDFRGDEHGIDFLNGSTDQWPVGRMTDFLTGGGPQPLGLSEAAVVYLKSQLEEK